MRTPAVSLALAALLFAAVLAGFLVEGRLDAPWIPSLGPRLAFQVDGLSALYGLFATGIGFAIVAYSTGYLPIHLRHQGRSRREERRFYALLVLFMVAMVGLVTADDLILVFFFWELTGVSSYFLIGYDRRDPKDRWAALMALLVTGITAVLLLVGALLLAHEHGTYSVSAVLRVAEGGTALTTTAACLIMVAALAKSAQVPLHFWLPRAMVAPTPVSAYLHSAALVAAGVFLLGRFYPLLERSPGVLDALLGIGIASMAVGSVIALTRDVLKQLLAYSTVAQYGYVVFMLGLGSPKAVAAAWLYVAVHALAKSVLFLTAGAVTIATGADRLSEVGGLRRALPVPAAASAVAGAGIAALPLTAGFFGDEAFFGAALDRSWLFAVVALLSAVLTFAYIGRFWLGVFAGRPTPLEQRPPWQTVAPLVVLAIPLVAFGFVPGPLSELASRAAAASVDLPAPLALAYHLDLRAENLLALATYVLGTGLILGRAAWWRPARAAARLGDVVGPDRAYGVLLTALNRLSDRMHAIEVRDLRQRVAAVLVPAGLLVLAAVAAAPDVDLLVVGAIGEDDVALAFVLGAMMLAAVATALARAHLTIVLTMSTVGFSLAVAYAFFGGPDVALVAVLVETILALLFLGVFVLLPRHVLRREATLPSLGTRRFRDPLVGVLSGVLVFFVAWAALARPTPDEPVAAELARLTPDVHAQDTVTAILADFRGLDTVGEITVLAVALIGIVSLLRRRVA